MTKVTERLKEIATRQAELRTELEGDITLERVNEIKEEARALSNEAEELRSKADLHDMLKPTERKANKVEETRAEAFAKSGRMVINAFVEERATLLSSGKLATPTAVEDEVHMLDNVVSSIVDDVEIIDATGTGAWEIPYQATQAVAANVTEGQKIGGTEATWDKVTVTPNTWGVLSELSNMVAKTTPANYFNAVQKASVFALRAKAKEEITKAVTTSKLVKKVPSVALDADYLRSVVLGFNADESLGGACKLYINREDLVTLGKVRGTQDKKPVYDIEYVDENNGLIKDGGLAVHFSINNSLEKGKQLYGQPKAVKLLLWGDYSIKTDEGGEYFARDVLAVRGLQTAGCALASNGGFALVGQSTLA